MKIKTEEYQYWVEWLGEVMGDLPGKDLVNSLKRMRF